MIDVLDGNNYGRKVYETDTAGLGNRRLFMNVYHNPNPVIVAFDGKGAKDERRKIYPGYKAKRIGAPDGFYRVLDFWKELLMHTHAVVIEIPGYEADDIIALLAGTTKVPMDIHSTDVDYTVLISDLVKVKGATLPEGLDVQDVRLYKTIVRDTSDNIPGIKRFGDTGWALLTRKNKDDIIQFLEGKAPWPNCLTSDKLNNWATENAAELRSFWQVVGFQPIPSDLLSAHMKIGKRDLALAESKLTDVQQGPTSVGNGFEQMRIELGLPPRGF